MSQARMDTAGVQRLSGNEVHFGFDLPPGVNSCLQQAAAQVASRELSLQALNAARETAPDCLEVLVALYKFHCYRGDHGKARDFIFQALVKSAREGGFSHDWTLLEPDSSDWNDPRGPGRIYLYSLKALAFIRLRENDLDGAGMILDVMLRLDPDDRTGADVIRELLNGLRGEREDG